MMGPRRGFALITVLWLITALSAVVAVGLGSVRLGHRTTLNRIALARGRWAAEACLAIVEARWTAGRRADTATISLGRDTWCAWRMTDPGARVNANRADEGVLATLVGEAVARAIVEARRDRPFAAQAPLLTIPGFPATDTLLFTVDGPGGVNANAAPARVLIALPGLTPEAAERIVWRRTIGRPFTTLDEVAGQVSPAARGALMAQYPDLVRTLTFGAQQLLVTAEGWVGAGNRSSEGGALRSTIEVLVVPLPERLAVIRRRMR